jgi:putative DNA primase/helicase
LINANLAGALAWYDKGFCVLPAMADGSKMPRFKWKEMQGVRPKRSTVETWYAREPKLGVGLICGDVSGNLELLELESIRMGSEFIDKVIFECRNRGIDWLWDLLNTDGYAESTPSGGIHLLYRVNGEEVPGNTKIAMDETGKITYAETRGRGGFVIVAPSGGTVHKTGESWTVLAGAIGEVPNVQRADRDLLHEAIKAALDERKIVIYEPRPAVPRDPNNKLPGDDFNERADWFHDVLGRHGWQYLGHKRGQDLFVHPYSSDMSTHSAATGYQGSPNLYAWSGMPEERHYDKFSALTYLEFNGDFAACARALRARGYGSPSEPFDDMSSWVSDPSTSEPRMTSPDDSTDPSGAPAEEPAAASRPKLTDFTEKGVGRFMGQVYGGKFRNVHEEKGWRVYRDGRWIQDKKAAVGQAAARVSDYVDDFTDRILAQAEKALADGAADGKDQVRKAEKLKTKANSLASDRGLKAIVSQFGQHADVAVSMDEFDTNRDLLALNNGTFDMATMELRPHNPNDMLTKRVAVTHDSQASAQRWNKFLAEVLPDPQIRAYIQRAVGMTMLAQMKEAAFFILHGDTGCGKSVFLEVIRAACGEYAATAPATTFQASRHGDGGNANNDLHSLRGVRFTSISETAEGTVLNETLVKSVTGGDQVKSRALYQDFVDWKPQFTVWMATNYLPNITSADNAMWRRVKPIEFPVSFYADGREPELGLASWIIDNELAGVFNWIMEGAQEYLRIGLAEPDATTEAIHAYRADVDPVQTFLTEAADEGRIELAEEVSIKSGELYAVYKAWCADNGVSRPLGDRKFGHRLTSLGFEAGRTTGGIRTRVGIRINPNFGFASAQRPAQDKWWKG